MATGTPSEDLGLHKLRAWVQMGTSPDMYPISFEIGIDTNTVDNPAQPAVKEAFQELINFLANEGGFDVSANESITMTAAITPDDPTS